MIISGNSCKKFYMSIFLFLALYAPPFLPRINFSHVMSFYSILALCFRYRRNFNHILNNKIITKFNKGIILVFVYWLIVFLIHYFQNDVINAYNYLSVCYRFFTTLIIIETIAIYVSAWTEVNNLEVDDIVECVIVCGMIEASISLLTLISPSVKSLLMQIIISNTGYYDHINTRSWIMDTKFYGFAAAMTDYFGLLTGLIAGICLFYAIDKKKKYLLCIPFLLLTTILNAITGVVVFMIATMLTAKIRMRRKIKINTFVFTPAIIIATIIAYNIIMSYNPMGIQKFVDNFWEIFDRSKVIASNTSMRVLFSDKFWRLPASINEIIFGTGHSLINAKGFDISDIGYINDIWSFGIVGAVALYTTYFKFFNSIPSKNYIFIKTKYLFLISFFIFNIKGLSFGMNSGNSIMILFTMLLITQNSRNGKTEDLLWAKMN